MSVIVDEIKLRQQDIRIFRYTGIRWIADPKHV